jgi:hypothetical protein
MSEEKQFDYGKLQKELKKSEAFFEELRKPAAERIREGLESGGIERIFSPSQFDNYAMVVNEQWDLVHIGNVGTNDVFLNRSKAFYGMIPLKKRN